MILFWIFLYNGKFNFFFKVKTGISSIRGNLTEAIWKMTYEEVAVLHEQNWTRDVVAKLQVQIDIHIWKDHIKMVVLFFKGFETEILNSMKLKGWDGNEDLNKIQWTFSGALFYSIIVITTIGKSSTKNYKLLFGILKRGFITVVIFLFRRHYFLLIFYQLFFFYLHHYHIHRIRRQWVYHLHHCMVRHRLEVHTHSVDLRQYQFQ